MDPAGNMKVNFQMGQAGRISTMFSIGQKKKLVALPAQYKNLKKANKRLTIFNEYEI